MVSGVQRLSGWCSRGAVLAVLGVSLAALMLLTQRTTAQSLSSVSDVPKAVASASAIGTVQPECGLQWRIVNSPNHPDNRDLLRGVGVVSPDDVWAVGSFHDETDTRRSIMHWDGSQWDIVPSPDMELNDIEVISQDDIWAVGFGPALHWDGVQWSLVSVPGVSVHLNAVDAISTDDVWAVGSAQSSPVAIHWDGEDWSSVQTPVPGAYWNTLSGVTAIATDDVWAVGNYSNIVSEPARTLAMHWDGNQWTVVSTPSPGTGNNYLRGVTAVSTNDIWAVGDYNGVGVPFRPLILHWDGSLWNVAVSDGFAPWAVYLYGVEAIDANNVWAVGSFDDVGGFGTLTIHWDGNQWQRVLSPKRQAQDNSLLDLSVISASDIWAVGSSGTYGGDGATLVEHYSDPCTIVTPTSIATSTATASSTPSPTPVPRLVIAQSEVYKPDGNNQGLDVYVRVTDLNGTPITGAQVTVRAVSNVGQDFTVTLSDMGGGEYQICGWQRFSGNAGDVTAYIIATKAGYQNASVTTTNRSGRWCGVTPTSTPAPTNTASSTNTPTLSVTATPGCGLNSDYTVSTAVGATIVPGATYVAGSTCNTCTVLLALPFAYDFYGNTYTQVRASNKGNLQFVSNSSSGADVCLPAVSLDDTIFAYWDDLNTNINDNLGIYTSISGTAPNRIFNIEWRARYIANDAAANFQARLYEGEPKLEIIYGNVTRRGFSATVGVQKGGDPTRFTQYACNTFGSIQPGTRLTFDRRVCAGPAVAKR